MNQNEVIENIFEELEKSHSPLMTYERIMQEYDINFIHQIRSRLTKLINDRYKGELLIRYQTRFRFQ